jgi:hypothetical protein
MNIVYEQTFIRIFLRFARSLRWGTCSFVWFLVRSSCPRGELSWYFSLPEAWTRVFLAKGATALCVETLSFQIQTQDSTVEALGVPVLPQSLNPAIGRFDGESVLHGALERTFHHQMLRLRIPHRTFRSLGWGSGAELARRVLQLCCLVFEFGRTKFLRKGRSPLLQETREFRLQVKKNTKRARRVDKMIEQEIRQMNMCPT